MLPRHLPVAVLTAFALSVVAHAQTSQTSGALRGTVKDRSGRAIGGATVRATNLETGAGRSLRTGAAGDYTFPLLPSGVYEVLVSAPGFKPVREPAVRVTLGNSVTLSPALEASEVGATVEVVAASSSVDTQQVNTVATIGQDLVEAVPLVTRNFTDIAKLSPGVTAGSGSPARLVVEGGRQIFNAIQIDGASNNSAFFNEQRGGVYTPFIFGADTIKELQVVTNGFDAQYAQAGATINAITKGGTNEVTGSALYQMRQTAWTESADRPPYGGSASSPRTNDSYNINFNVGGPLIKEKLFYFFGVERYHKKITAAPIPTSVTGALGMTQGDFNTFLASPLGGIITSRTGLTLAQEFGNPGAGIAAHGYPMENTNTVYFGRLDWVASQNHRFVLRANFQDMTDTLQNTSASPNNAESNNIPTRVQSISWVLEANDIWTPELYTESRLQLAREARPMTGNAAPGVPAIAIPTSGTNMSFGTKTSTPRESNEITTQFFSATTWAHGDFQLKGGIDLLRVDEDNQFFQNNAGSWRFDTYAGATAWATGSILPAPAAPAPNPGAPGGITYAGGVSPYNGRIPMWTHTNGFFGQMQYSGLLEKRLTLTAGFRYNKQEFSNNPHPNANFKGLDQGFGGSTTDPRFAFSYDLNGNGKTVIRGGYGVFTSPTPLLLHSNTMTGNGQIITNYSYTLNTANAANLALFNSGLLSASNLLSGTSLRKATDAELAAIATSGIFTAGASPTSLWDPSNKLSQSKKVNLGVERDLGNNLVVGISGTYVKYEHLQRFENINLGQLDGTGAVIAGGHYNDGYASANNAWTTATRPGYAIIGGRRVDFGPAATVPGNPVGGFSDVYLVKTDGYGFYRGISLSAKKTWNERTGLIANATWSRSQDTGSFERGTYTSASTDFTSELGASQTPDPQQPGSNFGYGDSDRRLVANAVFYFPIGESLDVAIRGLFQSGLPYTAYYSNDQNGDNMANHILAGHTRNDLRQPSYQQFDVRITRGFKLTKRFHLEAILDIYNVLNKADFNVTSANYKAGSLNTTTAVFTPNPAYGYLSLVDKTKTREVQLGIRIKY